MGRGNRKNVSENAEVWLTRSGFGESSMKETPKGGWSEVSLRAEQWRPSEKQREVGMKLELGPKNQVSTAGLWERLSGTCSFSLGDLFVYTSCIQPRCAPLLSAFQSS